LHELVELDLGLGALERAGVTHDLLVRFAVAIGRDRGLRLPFRIGNEFGRVLAAQQLLRDATLLLDHERCAFRLPYAHGVVALGRIDLDMDEADNGHGRSSWRGDAASHGRITQDMRVWFICRGSATSASALHRTPYEPARSSEATSGIHDDDTAVKRICDCDHAMPRDARGRAPGPSGRTGGNAHGPRLTE